MDDLLKDAIADAKAVRETALENAKIALEEAFTPRLQSMLSKKIQSEIEDDEVEEGEHDGDDEVEEEGYHENDEDPSDEAPAEPEMDMEEDEDEPEAKEEGIIEIDGVKYAPVVSEEEHEEEEVEEEVDQTSGIGSSDNKSGSADKSSAIGTKDKAKFESVEVTEEKDEDGDEVEEDIDLEEVLKALSEDEHEDEEEDKNEVAKLQSDLDEHRNVVKYLRSKLNEVNLLNAKLLFTNKLFRSNGLTNEQKMKVVETFDRAANLREVKLVYSTLAESFSSKQTKNVIKETKGSASKVVASTKSKKQEVIAEGHEMRDRFKKLAGIL